MSMTTRERIEADYIKEFKAKNTPAVEALRMLRSAIKNADIEKMQPLEEDSVVELVGREVKKLKDAADQFKSGGRADLFEKTEGEIALFSSYLPAQLSDDELRAIVSAKIAEAGEGVTAKDFGKVMSAVMAAAKGKADGGKVSAFVKEALTGK